MSRYSPEPQDARAFTQSLDRFYSRFAGAYDLAVRRLPLWRGWLRHVLPHLCGPRVLEVSFGTGYLLTQYAARFDVCALEYNARMIEVARENLRRAGMRAEIQRGTVDALPYASATFDDVVSTMAFSGYPDGRQAMRELARVLRPGGRLVLLDINYPPDGNRAGTLMTRLWQSAGRDLIRDMQPLFDEAHLRYDDLAAGGFGSVRLYLAEKG